MKNKIYSLVILIFCYGFTFSQHPFFDEFQCHYNDVGNDDINRGQSCANGNAHINGFYYDNRTPIKDIRINLIFIQKSDGSGNFQENNPEHQEFINNLMQIVNSKYSNLIQPASWNGLCNSGVGCYSQNHQSDSRIRFIDSRYYIKDDYYWNNNNSGGVMLPNLTNFYLLPLDNQINNDPNIPQGINIYFTENGVAYNSYMLGDCNTGFLGSHTYYGMSPNSDVSVSNMFHMPDLFTKYMWTKSCWEVTQGDTWEEILPALTNGTAGTIAHELGHSLDLGNHCQTTCAGVEQNPNIMNGSGGGALNYLSTDQLRRLAVTLHTKNIRRFVETCDVYQEQIPTSTTLEQDVKFYNNLRIPTGMTFTIKCRLVLQKGAKIIVEPGARLIVDGGVITTECSNLWDGIYVEGNRNLHQNSLNQGVVEMKNGAIIENASDAIRTIGVDSYGNDVWSQTGGIVWVENTIFKNCKRAIEFLSYENILPNGLEAPNKSYIRNTTFITTEELLGGHTPYAGVSMFGINGVQIKGCSFENQRIDLANIPVIYRGSGIISIDATYSVTSSYNALTGQPILNTGNTFTNLNHGVLISGGASRSDVDVNDNTFYNCAYGVSLNSSNYGEVARNTFDINGDVSTIQQFNFGFGLYSNSAWGFIIEDNVFNTVPSTIVYSQAIHIKNSGSLGVAKVRNNTITNVSYGTQITDDNYNLIVDCNTYNKQNYSKIDINHFNGAIASQGTNSSPNFNKHLGLACDNTSMAHVYESPFTSPANNLLYTAKNHPSAVNPTCHNLTNISYSTAPNVCAPSPEIDISSGALVVGAVVDVLQTELGVIKGTIEAKESLLATGNSQELMNAIETDPNGILKNKLMLNPYLSDRVLEAYLNRLQTPPGHLKEVLVANSPVSDEIKMILDNVNLPNGIRNQIIEAQIGISERQKLENEIKVFNVQKLAMIDAVVRTYLDTNWIDSATAFLEEEGSLEALCALVPLYGKKREVKAVQKIASIRQEANALLAINPVCKKGEGLNCFCNFYQLAMQIQDRPGGYFELTNAELLQLKEASESQSSIAANAKAILDFISEKTPRFMGDLIYFPTGKSMTNEEVEEIITIEKENIQLLVVPNPTTGRVSFELQENEDITNNTYEIVLTDMQGKLVKILPINNTLVSYEFVKEQQGIYLVHLLKNNERLTTQKLMLIE